ncbi:MAG: HdeD family acid-resistance protein [Deltaproteobacteria bacterium]|nr:HdeD family acid-resistance protein [Deltaproteobacteria bacterium]
MEASLSRNWWAFVMRGAIALTFAMIVFAWSEASPVSLARIFGVFAIAEGALAIGATMGSPPSERPWALTIEGTIGIAFGVVGLVAPFRSLTVVAWLIASWIATVGLLEGATALRVRRHLATPRVLAALAVVSLIAAAALIMTPRLGEIVTVWLLGAWSAFLGAATFIVGMVLRREDHERTFDATYGPLGTTQPSLTPVPVLRASRAPGALGRTSRGSIPQQLPRRESHPT